MTGRNAPPNRSGSIKDRKEKRLQAMSKVVDFIQLGYTVKEAMESVGRSEATYKVWRREEPWFAEAIDRARNNVANKSDFATFRKEMFGFDTFDHHQKIVDVLESAAPRTITQILLPPGAGKTTVLEDWICKLIAEDPNVRICVISKTEAFAKKILRRVSLRMTDPEVSNGYIERYGPFKPNSNEHSKPWNQTILTVVRAKSGERDYTLECKGVGNQIYGGRFDYILVDDVQDASFTPMDTKRIMAYLRQDVYSRFPPDPTKGRIYIIGSRVGEGDIYHETAAEEFVDNVVTIPARDEMGKVYWPFKEYKDAEGNVTMTVGYTDELMAEIEEKVGPEIWARTYMQKSSSGRSQTFSEDDIKRALNRNRDLNDGTHYGRITIGTMDPALGGHAAIRIFTFDYDKLYLLEGRHLIDLKRYSQLYNAMEELQILYRPSLWIIEGNSIQKGLITDERLEQMADQYKFKIEGHTTNVNKRDPKIGVASMEQSFRLGEIDIPYGSPNAEENVKYLLEDLRRWRPDIPAKQLRQDEVMALWFAYLYWMRMRGTLASKVSRHIPKRETMPWKATEFRAMTGLRQ
jgi:hypothetical protein